MSLYSYTAGERLREASRKVARSKTGGAPPDREDTITDEEPPAAQSHEIGEGEAATRDGGALVHPEAVREASEKRAGEESLAYLADTFQILANPTRLRIVEALARQELCVGDLAAVVDSSPSAVSHHLRQLRQMKIVRYRKDGRMAYYRLDDDHVSDLFRLGLEHVRE